MIIITHRLEFIIVLLLSFSVHFSNAFSYCYHPMHDGKRFFIGIQQLRQPFQRQSSWKHFPLLSSTTLTQSSLLMIKKKNGFSGGGGIGFGTKKKKDVNDNNNNNNGVGNVMRPTATIETTTIYQKSTILTTNTKIDASTETTDLVPILDKWGLPVPTLDDIFPTMPSDTLIIPANDDNSNNDNNKESSTVLSYIQSALQAGVMHDSDQPPYVLSPIQLSNLFDENGYEKMNDRKHYIQSRDDVDDDDKLIRKRFSELPQMKIKLMHHTPPVLVIENFLSPEECNAIQQITSPISTTTTTTNNNNAIQVNSATLSSTSISKRTSTSWFCSYESVPIFMNRVIQLLNQSIYTMEEPQIVRYKSQQLFDWHYDIIPTTQCHNGGQRIATLLVYLNTLPHDVGGRTVFRDLHKPIHSDDNNDEIKNNNDNSKKLAIRPIQGNAILFFPSTTNGIPDDRTLHQGEVVLDNEYDKHIIQIWIHQFPNYTASLPSTLNCQSKCPII